MLKTKEDIKKRVLELQRIRRNANIDKTREETRKWRLANPEKMKASIKKWALANPESAIIRRARRRAKKYKATTNCIFIDKFLIFIRKNKCNCYWCGKPTATTCDHLQPLSKNGLHHIDNVQAACNFCNCSKKDKTEEEFLSHIKKMGRIAILDPSAKNAFLRLVI